MIFTDSDFLCNPYCQIFSVYISQFDKLHDLMREDNSWIDRKFRLRFHQMFSKIPRF